jgi:hypothetical protein
MIPEKIPTYRINKNGKTKDMITSLDGEWIKRIDYEFLLDYYKRSKEDWNLDNAMLNLSRVIDNQKANAEITLALQMLASSMILCMKSILEKYNKEQEIIKK